jgi:N-acetylmuramoyl-L-alanine amidase
MNAYRAIYHANPAARDADASVSAVADLLAEEGRVFQNDKALHDAIGQYAFLRQNYPGSRYRFSALLTTGEIYLRDLNDPDSARAAFEDFLRKYPRNALANEARIELRNLRYAPHERLAKTEIAHDEASPIASHAKSAQVLGLWGSPGRHEGAQAGRSSADREQPTPDGAGRAEVRAPHREAVRAAESAWNAPPPPRKNHIPLVTGIRYWSTPVYTRVAIDLESEVQYQATRVEQPDRIFFDLYGARLSPVVTGKSDQVIDDGYLRQIRAAQFRKDVVRVVLNVSDVSEYSAFFLPNPPRLIIDIHGSKRVAPLYSNSVRIAKAKPGTRGAEAAPLSIGLGPELRAANRLGAPVPAPARKQSVTVAARRRADTSDVESLDRLPDEVHATQQPTMDPVAQSVAGTTPAPQTNEVASVNAPTVSRKTAPTRRARQAQSSIPVVKSAPMGMRAPPPTADGATTMVRTLGLKINRIVIDAGHGGHDSGTLGPGGIEEKNVVLDVALRLGALLKQRLGADVIYTRDDDTFIPLETRTAIANKDQADLFISVHANSSSDPTVRGVEVYYLNFTTSADALAVAARENAVSDQSIHQLGDLVRKIALQDKINESREFAEDVDQSLYSGLEPGNPGLKDRGVKKAPFVVLIGANMPSILAEISFLTNPESADDLRQPQYRERIAESLYRGVARYVDNLNGVRLAQVSPRTTR